MSVIEMVEGKDQLLDLGLPEFEGIIGKTGRLLLRILNSCFNTGRYEVLDSGYCVLKAILACMRRAFMLGHISSNLRNVTNYVMPPKTTCY